MIYINENLRKDKKVIFRKIIAVFILCTIFINSFSFVNAKITQDLPVSEMRDDFPQSYKPYIDILKKEHPNWVFKAIYTNLDWNLAIKHESYEINPEISLINKNDYSDRWLYNGNNIAHDGPFYTASKAAVAYAMDPRNFLNENAIFQFETLSFSSNVHKVEIVEKILSSTPMGSGEYKNKYKFKGKWIQMGESYAEMIIRLSKKYNISPTHVASRIRQENSGDIVNGALINGSEGVYNFFNIGATPGANGNSAVTNGLNYARDNGWTTPEKSIEAGIAILVKNYIQYGQDTIYFQKFDVNNPYGNAQWLFASQYMTNIMAPYNESTSAYSGYVKSGMINSDFEFHIPVYNNMPSVASPSPDVADERFEPDNTRVYLDDPSDSGVVDEFWIRSSPNSSSNSNIIEKYYEQKDGQENRTPLIRIGKGINTPWDKVKLPDGRVGFVSSKWVYEYKYSDVTGVKLDNTSVSLKSGENITLKATISPINAISTDVKWSTSDENVAIVDGNGKITAKNPGEATITVTTVNSSKTATCKVKVISTNVESITLPKTEYSVIENETLILTPIILPDTATNKNYTISIQDENILEEKDGKLIGRAQGTTYVTFKTEDGNKTLKVKINVIKLNEDDIVIDESIKVDNNTNYITKIDPETKIKNIKEKIKTKLDVKYFDINSKELSDESFIGTGSKIKFIKDGNVLKEYTVIILGDVNGDGKITSKDYMMVKNHIMDKNKVLQGVQSVAADPNKDNKITSKDYMIIKNHIMNKN